MRKWITVIGIAGVVLVAAGVFVLRSDSVMAALTELAPVESFDRWAWSGAPVDQYGSTEGSSPDTAVGFLLLECDTSASVGDPAACTATSGTSGYAYPSVRVDDEDGSSDEGSVEGFMWFGTYGDDDSSGYPIGWIDLDPKPLDTSTYAAAACILEGSNYPAQPCHDAQLNEDNLEEVEGWARIPTIACEGHKVLNGATTCDYNDPTHVDNDWGWVLMRGTNTADSDEYGVIYRNGTLEGWAWSGGGSLSGSSSYSNAVGLGWIDFSAGSGGSSVGPQGDGYLATEQGDVYVRDGITNPGIGLSPTQYQSTYLILTNGTITQFDTAGSTTDFEDTSFQLDGNDLEVPDDDNSFSTELGVIDLDKLTTTISGGQNIYNQDVTTITSGSMSTFNGGTFMDGGVYIFDDGSSGQSYTLDESLTFLNGTSSTPSSTSYNGSGTIIIDGDLTIDANVFYNNTDLQDIKNLASIAWIVLGDLTIGENVSNLVGNYFVLGDDSIDTDGDGVVHYGDSDGVIYTVAPTNGRNGSQLVVYGSMMARKFDLNRNYEGLGEGSTSGEDEPSELIIYDGRIVANTPPGFQDFSSLLPEFGTGE